MDKIHFIIQREYSDFLSVLRDSDLERNYPYWLGGRLNWPAQAWLLLRKRREGCTIGIEPLAGCINVAHAQTWRTLGRRQGEFRLSARADCRRVYDVDFEVVQNPTTAAGKHRIYLPYWPVPRLVGRDPKRAGVTTVAFAGRPNRGNLPRGLGGANPLDLGKVELRVIPPDEWHDMSAVDVLVGVRSFDRKQYPSKPPSKMIHAWRSGIPFIGGWDSAYSAVARPGAEYIRVASITELRSEIRRLAENPACYDRLVEKGRRRAPEFSHEAIAGLWLSALDGPVQTAFEVWLEKNGRSRGWIRHRADVVADVASQVKSRWRRVLVDGR